MENFVGCNVDIRRREDKSMQPISNFPAMQTEQFNKSEEKQT